MAASKPIPQPLPPYVPYRTFVNFVQSLGQAIPGRIDRTLMTNMSGATQNQLMTALRYLSLVKENGTPDDRFVQLIRSEDEAEKRVLRSILETAYPFLFHADGFNLTNCTAGQFEGQFRAAGANGDTVRKCAAFFLAAAKDAEIPLSPRLTKLSRPRASTTRPIRPHGEPTPKRGSGSAKRTVTPTPVPFAPPSVQPSAPAGTARSLQLRGGGDVTLMVNVDWFTIDERDRCFVLHLIDMVRRYESEKPESIEAEDAWDEDEDETMK